MRVVSCEGLCLATIFVYDSLHWAKVYHRRGRENVMLLWKLLAQHCGNVSSNFCPTVVFVGVRWRRFTSVYLRFYLQAQCTAKPTRIDYKTSSWLEMEEDMSSGSIFDDLNLRIV